MTLEEIADELGVTRERVRQIEKMALQKLRIRLRRYGLELEDLIPDYHEDRGAHRAGGKAQD